MIVSPRPHSTLQVGRVALFVIIRIACVVFFLGDEFVCRCEDGGNFKFGGISQLGSKLKLCGNRMYGEREQEGGLTGVELTHF